MAELEFVDVLKIYVAVESWIDSLCCEMTLQKVSLLSDYR